ncbi:MAG: pentapeptide repeat-containing protein [Planctomycetales bacterium]|nr:pentapeptide repeat-containing protein [Planctomycetales bacterium]
MSFSSFFEFLRHCREEISDLVNATSLLINILALPGALGLIALLTWLRRRAKADGPKDGVPAATPPPELMELSADQRHKCLRQYRDTMLTWSNEQLRARSMGGAEQRLARQLTVDGELSPLASDQFLDHFGSFVLLGEGGVGKSSALTLMLRNLLEMSDGGAPSDDADDDRPDIVPTIVLARDIVKRIAKLDVQLADGLGDERDVIEGMLRDRLTHPLRTAFPNWDQLGADRQIEQFRLAMGRGRAILLVDGFDEIAMSDRPNLPLKALVLDAIDNLLCQLRPQLQIVISSRIGDGQLLKSLGLRVAKFASLGARDVANYVAENWPSLSDQADHIAERFEVELGARPLYLRPLCEYYRRRREQGDQQPAAKISRSELLEAEADALCLHNDQKTHGLGELLRRLLMSLSIRHARRQLLQLHDVEELAASVSASAGRRELAATLANAVRAFLAIDDNVNVQFLHLDHRDFWIANAISQQLSDPHGGLKSKETAELLLLVFEYEAVFGFCLEVLGTLDPHQQAARVHTLMEIANRKTMAQSNRHGQTSSAAALSLLLRLSPAATLREELACDGQNLRGLQARGQDLSSLDLRRADLSRADLRGATLRESRLSDAVLNNADLHGADFSFADLTNADLTNCGLGSYATSAEARPSKFEGADLKGSNWFNFRVTMDGYLQFWKGAVHGGALLVATNRGLYGVALADLAATIPSHTADRVATSLLLKESDVLDFDVRLDQDYLLVAGREGRTTLVEVARVSAGDLLSFGNSLEVTSPKHHFGQYPRRILASPSGSWICVTDRANNVYMRRVEGGLPHPSTHAIRVHLAPVMCLLADETWGCQAFYTAGYDGVVYRHTEPRNADKDWETELVAAVAPKHQEGNVIRAMLPQADASGRLAGIWIGVETGDLLYWQRKTGQLRSVLSAPEGIFELAHLDGGSVLAIGMSDGRILVCTCSRDEHPRLERRRTLTPPADCAGHGEIVRSIVQSESCIMAVLWSGRLVRWRHLDDDSPVELKLDIPPSADAADTRNVIFRTDVSNIQGLPASYVKYLATLQ